MPRRKKTSDLRPNVQQKNPSNTKDKGQDEKKPQQQKEEKKKKKKKRKEGSNIKQQQQTQKKKNNKKKTKGNEPVTKEQATSTQRRQPKKKQRQKDTLSIRIPFVGITLVYTGPSRSTWAAAKDLDVTESTIILAGSGHLTRPP